MAWPALFESSNHSQHKWCTGIPSPHKYFFLDTFDSASINIHYNGKLFHKQTWSDMDVNSHMKILWPCNGMFLFLLQILTSSGVFHLLENSGDPWRNFCNFHELGYGECLYFMFVTMSTVSLLWELFSFWVNLQMLCFDLISEGSFTDSHQLLCWFSIRLVLLFGIFIHSVLTIYIHLQKE